MMADLCADVIVIDGRSGSGKTSLAELFVRQLQDAGRDVRVLHVEDLYPGWDGLSAGSLAVAEALAAGGYRRYDWDLAAFAEWVELVPACPPSCARPVPPSSCARNESQDQPIQHPVLIIEGCGAVTQANLAAATAWANRSGTGTVRSIWMDAPTELRRSRALARDGDMFAPHWDSWAAQEDELFARTRPELLADHTLPVR